MVIPVLIVVMMLMKANFFTAILVGELVGTVMLLLFGYVGFPSLFSTEGIIVTGFSGMVILMMFSYTNVFAICDDTLPIYSILSRLGFGWLTWIYVTLMTLAVLTSAAGLAFAGTVRFDSLLKGIQNKKARSAIITIVLLGLATVAASFGLKSLMSVGNSVIGYLSIIIIVIPAFTLVRSKLKER